MKTIMTPEEAIETMNDRSIFENDDYCISELSEVLKIICKKPLTEEVASKIKLGLSIMYPYCSDHVKISVMAVMNEVIIRGHYSFLREII